MIRVPIVLWPALICSLFLVDLLSAEEFLFDDFEDYFSDADVQDLGEWVIVDENMPVESSTWTIFNPGGRGNPPGVDGTPSDGQFMVSDSDAQGASNPCATGMSHDIWSPELDLTSATGAVWIHFDCLAELNNNGNAVFDVDLSLDGGETWTNEFRRVSPGRPEGGADCGPPIADTTNSDGFFGRLHVDISEAAGKDQVRFRVRHFEPNFDWWIAIDNVIVDEEPPPQPGAVDLMAVGTFTLNVPSSWRVRSDAMNDPPNSAVNTWHVGDKGRRYSPGEIAERNVNRINHPNPAPDFAIADSISGTPQDEWLITPAVDCSQATEVFLHYEEETSPGALVQEVLVSLDGGASFETAPLFSYNLGAGFDAAEEPFYAQRSIPVLAVAGEDDVAFAFHYGNGGDENWWAIDDVRITANGAIPTPIRNCATRGLTVGEFDPSVNSVVLRWEQLEGDESYRILRKTSEGDAGTPISGDLSADTTTFTDSEIPEGVREIRYALQSTGAGALECETRPIRVIVCPANLACCVNQVTGEANLRWDLPRNVVGQAFRITRNGLPLKTVPLDATEFEDMLPEPGEYEYSIILLGGDQEQCPELPLTCFATWDEEVAADPSAAFFEDFEQYDKTASLSPCGWELLTAPAASPPPEDGSQWLLAVTDDSCTDRGSNPPGEDGLPSSGRYLISDNDCGGVSIAEGAMQSFDLVSPPFSTEGLDTVWLHMNLSAVLNNNGSVVVDIDVSTDGGTEWTNLWRRVGANRGAVEPLPRAEIPEGSPNGPQEGNSDGFFGRLHLDMSDVAAQQSQVRFRVRHFEPNYDWWVAVDDIVVDDQPHTGGDTVLLSEGFDDGIPDDWEIGSSGLVEPWTADDPCDLSLLNFNGGEFPDQLDGRRVHYFDHRFALIDPACLAGGGGGLDEFGESLITPIINASRAEMVYLHFRSNIRVTSAVAEVLVSVDGGESFETEEPVFTYSRDGLFYRDEGNSELAYNAYILPVPVAAGEGEVAFAFFHDATSGWWAIDDVMVTADVSVPEGSFVRGDADADGTINLTDGLVILNHLFAGRSAPLCQDGADSDDSGSLDVTDAVRLFVWLFQAGEAPAPPSPTAGSYAPGDCGPDPTEDDLDCSVLPGPCAP